MKKNVLVLLVGWIGFSAHAQVLPPAKADAICHAKALRAAHFMSESQRHLVVKYTVDGVAEISTKITYEYSYSDAGVSEPIYTVIAYAYPDDHSCTIGSVVNNIAGND